MEHALVTLPWWSVLPFIGLLLSIALLPLAASRWWDSHHHKAWVGAVFAVPIVLVILQHTPRLLLHTMEDYVAFIVLLGSLFTIAGGLVIEGDLEATPAVNTALLAVGAVLANVIGTTGASMVLIRPVLRTNRDRTHTSHIPIFFIFLVSNIGGCLTPLGDPPLFLGFLQGVPFTWTLALWPEWLTMVGLLTGVFYLYDTACYRREPRAALRADQAHRQPLRLAIVGRRNLVWLAGVVGAVFLSSWWRILAMAACGACAYLTTPPRYREKNAFIFGPIIEVAILFAGIFITMVPALELLREHGDQFGITQPWQFFWLSGALSSVLDNAPTYLTFASLAQGLHLPGDVIGIPARLLQAVSLGAVFMGANTYIGNGPNFMVKAIAESSGIKMPSFFGYLRYVAVVLLPLYLIITVVFFRP